MILRKNHQLPEGGTKATSGSVPMGVHRRILLGGVPYPGKRVKLVKKVYLSRNRVQMVLGTAPMAPGMSQKISLTGTRISRDLLILTKKTIFDISHP